MCNKLDGLDYNWASQLLFHVGKPTKQQPLPFPLLARAYRRKKVSLVLESSIDTFPFPLVGKSLQEENGLTWVQPEKCN